VRHASSASNRDLGSSTRSTRSRIVGHRRC
jgi:hypothetical protein